MNDNKYIKNNLFTESVMASLCKDLSKSRDFYDFLRRRYQESRPENTAEESDPENSLCNVWIAPILKELGWYYSAQQRSIRWEDRENKLDFSLYPTEAESEGSKPPLVFLEAKKWGLSLGKGGGECPYRQAMRYIRAIEGQSHREIVYGFLSNGQSWWCCANFGAREHIARCEIKLLDIITHEYDEDSARALALFIRLFGAPYHACGDSDRDGQSCKDYVEQVKEDVRCIITGMPFENIGKSIFSYERTKRGESFSADTDFLRDVYHHSLTLAFRLIFQAYIEAKYPDLLDENTHPTYKHYSLSYFDKHSLDWAKLCSNFHTLDSGDIGNYMPVFNGGLFANHRTPILDEKDLFTDEKILEIVRQFLYKNENPVDYARLEVRHFSEIYEELLQFEFRLAQGKMYYVHGKSARGGGKQPKDDGFYGPEDFAVLKTTYPDLHYTQIPSGELYLTSKTLSRKVSGSYYTPESLTEFMCRTSISEALRRCIQEGRSVLDLKILDNACGSGHFLTGALDILFEEVLHQNLTAKDDRLRRQLKEDTDAAKEVMKAIRYTQDISEDMVLKRLLLKHCIYGVDMNAFAVEIARASLWLNTFVFGIPLAFIEHHVVEGNSLVGYIEQINLNDSTTRLFMTGTFERIREIFLKINNISDMTGEQVKQSHALYEGIRAELHAESLKLSHDLFAEFQNETMKESQKENSAIHSSDPFIDKLEGFAQWFKPFHYRLIFPELWDIDKNKFKGFDIVIGNPPWDKVKFEEPAFFMQYRANYNKLNDKQKKQARANVLATLPGVAEDYRRTKSFVESQMIFLPLLLPEAQESGDQNLFRYFIARGLSLLAPGGLLCYLTPSTWSYEAGSTPLRRFIWKNYHTHYFIQFENKGIFKNLHDQYKFACFLLSGGSGQKTIPTLFMQRDTFILRRLWDEGFSKLTLAYPTRLIHQEEGEILRELSSQTDLDLVDRFKNNPLLKDKLTQNYIEFVRDFDMTNDVAKHIGVYFFHSPEGLAHPQQLVESKYFHQFNTWHETKDSKRHPRWYDAAGIREYPKLKNRIAQQGFCDADGPRLAWRRITNATNERTVIFCLLPSGSLAGNTAWISTGRAPLWKLLFIQGIGNSLIFDYQVRQAISLDVTKQVMDNQLCPQPSEQEFSETPKYRRIAEISALLSLGHGYTTPDLPEGQSEPPMEFLQEHGFCDASGDGHARIPDTDEQRVNLRARLDIIVARDIYGLTLQEMLGIIDRYFPQWKKAYPLHINLIESLWDEKLY